MIISASSSSSTAASAATDDSATLVSLNIKVLLDNNLATLVLVPVHLVDGLLGQLHRVELHDSCTSRLASLIIKQLNIRHLAHLLPEQVLHLLPLHVEGEVGDENSPLRRSSLGLPLFVSSISSVSSR